jgi:hypothetical protein
VCSPPMEVLLRATLTANGPSRTPRAAATASAFWTSVMEHDGAETTFPAQGICHRLPSITTTVLHKAPSVVIRRGNIPRHIEAREPSSLRSHLPFDGGVEAETTSILSAGGGS